MTEKTEEDRGGQRRTEEDKGGAGGSPHVSHSHAHATHTRNTHAVHTHRTTPRVSLFINFTNGNTKTHNAHFGANERQTCAMHRKAYWSLWLSFSASVLQCFLPPLPPHRLAHATRRSEIRVGGFVVTDPFRANSSCQNGFQDR